MKDYILEKFKNKLNHFKISDYYGLNSPGLTCYLNSVLQVLFMTEDFREAIKQCCSKEVSSIDPQLESLFNKLEKEVTQTDLITRTLGITDIYTQRDAAEYFEKILCLTSPEASKIFKGELNHKTTCHRCKERSDCRSFFWTLPLAMGHSSSQIYSVEEGLKAFFRDEKVCGENQMYCDRCGKKQNADLECEMTQNPEILTLLLKRFSLDHKQRCYVKLHCDADVPRTLRLRSCTYHLYALVNHVGDLMRGHYTAHIKSFETGAWYHFDDRTVKHVKPPLFVSGKNCLRSCTAYLLMYRKVNDKDDQEAHFARSDVRREGRRKASVPRHQPRDDGCYRREEDCAFEPNHDTHMQRLSTDQSGRTRGSVVTETGTKTSGSASSRAGKSSESESSETKGMRNKSREVGARMNMGGFDVNEAQHMKKRENTSNPRERRNAQKRDSKVTPFR